MSDFIVFIGIERIKMYILLSNDDGYLAQGLNALADALSEKAEISVVAPDKNRSGASNSLDTYVLYNQLLPTGSQLKRDSENNRSDKQHC